MNQPIKVRWFTDPKYSWLCVPAKFADTLPLTFTSPESRRTGEHFFYFLEGADADLFLDYASKNGIELDYAETDHDPFISYTRKYQRLVP